MGCWEWCRWRAVVWCRRRAAEWCCWVARSLPPGAVQRFHADTNNNGRWLQVYHALAACLARCDWLPSIFAWIVRVSHALAATWRGVAHRRWHHQQQQQMAPGVPCTRCLFGAVQLVAVDLCMDRSRGSRTRSHLARCSAVVAIALPLPLRQSLQRKRTDERSSMGRPLWRCRWCQWASS